ncbi:MAG: hypothetical protein Q4B58_08905, partial [Bacteroidales bacterium]|nr:hypothetical protein [Bacteroidales bacterium]
MKRMNLMRVFSLLLASLFVMTSCSDDDNILAPEIEQPVAVWVEPFHVQGGVEEDVKAFMARNLPGMSLNEQAISFGVQLSYSKPGTDEGMVYSFTTNNGLYSVIDTEPTSRMDAVLQVLHKQYVLVSSNPETQYIFTTNDRKMVVSIQPVNDRYFNVCY